MYICPICNRPIPDDQGTEHHLIPNYTKLKQKGKQGLQNAKVMLHYVCHQKLHSLYTNKELSKKFNTIEKLISSPEIQEFAEWVRKKPIDFVDTSKQSNTRKTRSRFS
jgi:hypothetical protein